MIKLGSSIRRVPSLPSVLAATWVWLAALTLTGCHVEFSSATADRPALSESPAQASETAANSSAADSSAAAPAESVGSTGDPGEDVSKATNATSDQGENATTSGASRQPVVSSADAAVPQRPKRKTPQVVLGGLNSVTFDDLEIGMTADTVFKRSMLTDFVKELEGERVRLRGFIHAGTVLKQRGIKQFLLLKNTECPFGEGGQAHHIVRVDIPEGNGISFTVLPVTVEGKLTIQTMDGPDGNTWLIYHMLCDKVE